MGERADGGDVDRVLGSADSPPKLVELLRPAAEFAVGLVGIPLQEAFERGRSAGFIIALSPPFARTLELVPRRIRLTVRDGVVAAVEVG